MYQYKQIIWWTVSIEKISGGGHSCNLHQQGGHKIHYSDTHKLKHTSFIRNSHTQALSQIHIHKLYHKLTYTSFITKSHTQAFSQTHAHKLYHKLTHTSFMTKSHTQALWQTNCMVGTIHAVMEWTPKIQSGYPINQNVERNISNTRCLRTIFCFTLIMFSYAFNNIVLCYKPEGLGWVPAGVIRIFPWLNPSGRIVALGSTQPLTEMSTRNPSWG
jgi:hypothetical protein